MQETPELGWPEYMLSMPPFQNIFLKVVPIELEALFDYIDLFLWCCLSETWMMKESLSMV